MVNTLSNHSEVLTWFFMQDASNLLAVQNSEMLRRLALNLAPRPESFKNCEWSTKFGSASFLSIMCALEFISFITSYNFLLYQYKGLA